MSIEFFLKVSAVLISALTFFILRKRATIYRYNTRQDYCYTFEQSVAQKFVIQVQKNGFTMPDLGDGAHSIFLQINVKTSCISLIFKPTININQQRHTLEHGAQGLRFLNISSAPSNGTIAIYKRHLHVADQACVWVFKNTDVSTTNLMVIASHPDDAEIGAYGLYAQNPNNSVLTLTAGDNSPNQYHNVYNNSHTACRKKSQLRVWDSLTVPLQAGLSTHNVLNLGFFDGTLAHLYQQQHNTNLHITSQKTGVDSVTTYRQQNLSPLSSLLPQGNDWANLVNCLKTLLQHTKPEIIVSPYPAIDGHSDHQYSAIALFEAIKQLNLRTGQLFLYTNHALHNRHYPYGKMREPVSLPPNFQNDLYFDALHSQPLDDALQNDKIFALESIHALRFDMAWQSPWRNMQRAWQLASNRILNRDSSYFRKAVRSNELFFVVEIANLYNEVIYQKVLNQL
jgi:LmbE family N-acetylglucosaminyl deacetylase